MSEMLDIRSFQMRNNAIRGYKLNKRVLEAMLVKKQKFSKMAIYRNIQLYVAT